MSRKHNEDINHNHFTKLADYLSGLAEKVQQLAAKMKERIGDKPIRIQIPKAINAGMEATDKLCAQVEAEISEAPQFNWTELTSPKSQSQNRKNRL